MMGPRAEENPSRSYRRSAVGRKSPLCIEGDGDSSARAGGCQVNVGFRIIRESRVLSDSYVHGIIGARPFKELDWKKGDMNC